MCYNTREIDAPAFAELGSPQKHTDAASLVPGIDFLFSLLTFAIVCVIIQTKSMLRIFRVGFPK